jgi:hypothetical protein
MQPDIKQRGLTAEPPLGWARPPSSADALYNSKSQPPNPKGGEGGADGSIPDDRGEAGGVAG